MLTVKKGIYYLAGPYTAQRATTPTEAGQEMHENFDALTKHAAKLLSEGINVYSPITHSHLIALHHKLPCNWEFWEQVDRAFIERCDGLIVLMRDGWETSRGVQAEIQIAQALELPVVYHYETDDMEILVHA